jgi:hypothetical protein
LALPDPADLELDLAGFASALETNFSQPARRLVA